jgi:hypothetical protein
MPSSRRLLVAGSLASYAVSVHRELGPVAYNLGGLMMIGSVVLTLREKPEERIWKAYEQRVMQLE